jgi:hypothetical protein
VFAIVACTGLYAQSFTASASQTTVPMGEQFQVSYTINTNASAFRAPSFGNFNVYSGPNQSTSMEYVNGNMSQSVSISYILAPKQEGTFTIGPATITISGGKTLTSNSLTITVVKGSAQQSTAQNGNQQQQTATTGNGTTTDPSSQIKQNLFIRVVPEKSTAYQGEGIPVTVKVYTRLGLQGFQDITFPDYNGFFSQDIVQKGQVSFTREVVNGATFQVATLKQNVIFAQRSGKLKIGEVSAQCVVQERVKGDPNNLFDQFFGTYKKAVYEIKSEPVTINILPLPSSDKPFSGAIGHYTIKGSLDRTSVKANDAINLSLTVSGEGALKLIDSIPLSLPPDVDHYDPKITDKITVSPSGVSGSRTFNYLLIPRHEGKYKIPAINFTYFNPAKKTYETSSIPEMNIDVAKGDNNSAAVVTNNGTPVSKEDVKVLSSDIRYIHTGHMPAYPSDDYFLYSMLFCIGIGTPILGFLGFLFFRRQYVESHKDVIALKQRGATRMAKKRLKVVQKYIASGNKEAFYDELLNALNKYLGDKFTIPVADLSKETISQKLLSNKVTPETSQQLIQTLDACEYVRYAPAAVAGNLNEVYESAVTLITKLEDEIVA